MGASQPTIARLMREDWGRLLSTLVKDLRSLELAEDALSAAFESAIQHWHEQPPHNPRGWLLQVARRKAIDQLRRAQTSERYADQLAHLRALDCSPPGPGEHLPDDRLPLFFTACHPALAPKTQVALTLRTLSGLSTAEIARAFLDQEPAMAQRLSRARKKIRLAGIPYRVPEREDWEPRLEAVLTTVYLIFNQGYSAPRSTDRPLCAEAINLSRALCTLCPDDPEASGLLSLLLLNHARSPARLSPDGTTQTLETQDRRLWDQTLADEGLQRIQRTLRRGRPGPFQLQAAISAIHIEAPDFGSTPWQEIALIYDRLLELRPNPVIALNRAVAVSFWRGPEQGLALLPTGLDDYQAFHAARADMQRRLDRPEQANAAYERALLLTQNAADRRLLEQRKEGLDLG